MRTERERDGWLLSRKTSSSSAWPSAFQKRHSLSLPKKGLTKERWRKKIRVEERTPTFLFGRKKCLEWLHPKTFRVLMEFSPKLTYLPPPYPIPTLFSLSLSPRLANPFKVKNRSKGEGRPEIRGGVLYSSSSNQRAAVRQTLSKKWSGLAKFDAFLSCCCLCLEFNPFFPPECGASVF